MFDSDIRWHLIISTVCSLLRSLLHITRLNTFWLVILLLDFCFFDGLFVRLDFFNVRALAEFALDFELFIT